MPEPILDAVEQKVGYFLVAGLTQRDRQPFLTTTNLEASINLAPQTAFGLWEEAGEPREKPLRWGEYAIHKGPKEMVDLNPRPGNSATFSLCWPLLVFKMI